VTLFNQPDYKKLHDLCSLYVRLPSNQSVSNPVAQGHVGGIFQHLKDEYLKMDFVSYDMMMTTLWNIKLSPDETINNVEALQLTLSDSMKTAEYLQLFKFMTPDWFYTWLSLRALGNDNIRNDALATILPLTTNSSEPSLDFSEKPLFDALWNHLKMKQHAKRMSDMPVTKLLPATNIHEAAASTTDTNTKATSAVPAKATTKATSAKSTEQKKTYNAIYNTIITRDANLKISEQYDKYPYTATESVCSACNNRDPSKHHKPRCFIGLFCGKCFFFGHKIRHCMQQNQQESPGGKQLTYYVPAPPSSTPAASEKV